MILWVYRCVVALVAACPLFVFAWQDSCPESPQDRFSCLAAHEVEYAGILDYELALADAARLAGDSVYAAIVLERVVIRHPRQAGARLDLVILSLEIGDTLAAERHLDVLKNLPDPPPMVALLLKQLDARLNPADQAFEQQLKFLGSLGLGHDTNPNLGVVADAIDLIINGQPQTLVPDSLLEPSPDFFLGMSAAIEYPYSPKGVVTSALVVREYDTLDDEDALAAYIRLFHNLKGNSFLEATLADFRTAEGLYLSRAGIGLRQRFGSCRCSSVGILGDVLRGGESSAEASRARLEFETERNVGVAKLLVHSGLDYSAQPNAGWGDTLGADVGVDMLARLWGFNLTSELSAYKGWDENAYSPLFGSSRRDVLRSTFRAGLSYPVVDGLDIFADWSYSRQESDVVLFDYSRHVSTLGLRLNF
jgi:hypothetical protein